MLLLARNRRDLKVSVLTVTVMIFVLISSILFLPPRVRANPDVFWKIPIVVSAPTTANITVGSPVIITLGSLAANMPAEVDPFGLKTPTVTSDDVDWTAIYLYLTNARIPTQVDDVDTIPGPSEGDELVFEVPSTILAGASETFSLYFTTVSVGLPSPSYSFKTTVYPYPYVDYENTIFGGSTIGESYTMKNDNITAVVLVAGAYASGAIWRLIINQTGFDIVKQNANITTNKEGYKWKRFANPSDTGWAENNPAPSTGDDLLSIIVGPVRSIVKMRSTVSYDSQNNIFDVVTYTLYANQPWLDYELNITGPAVTPGMTLDINLRNRDQGTFSPIYDTVFVPGKGEMLRLNATGLAQQVLPSSITQAWYADYNKTLDEGWGIAYDRFSDLNLMAWSKYTEGISLLFGNPSLRTSVDSWATPTMDNIGMHFPFHARYFPIDSSITAATPAGYMSTMYQDWLATPTVTIQQAQVTTLPFTYVRVSIPTATYDNSTKIMNILQVTANDSATGPLNNTDVVIAKYFVYTSLGTPTGIEGNLTWTGTNWGASNVDLSSLAKGLYYVECYIKDSTGADGQSKRSNYIGEITNATGPTVQSVNYTPQTPTSSDTVTVTATITDTFGVQQVILSYFDGSKWVNETTTKAQSTYTGVIPKMGGGSTVQFKIYAQNILGIWTQSSVYSYTVQSPTSPTTVIIALVVIIIVVAAIVGFTYYTRRVHKQEYKPVIK